MTKTIQRLEEAAVEARLVDRSQPLWVMPTLSFWKSQELGWLSLVLAGVLFVLVIAVDVHPVIGGLIPIAVLVVMLGLVERRIRRRIKRRSGPEAQL